MKKKETISSVSIALFLTVPAIIGGYTIRYLLINKIIQENVGVLLFFCLLLGVEFLWITAQQNGWFDR